MRHMWTLVLGVTALVGCVKNAATGERQFTLIGRKAEISMGKEAAQQVVSSMGMVDNPSLSKYVADIGQRLAAKSERPELPWSFQVVDDPAVNAFALPGGYIFVTRGILAHLDNEAQLASVLGHEIGHVTGKHSVNQMSKAQVAQIGLGLGMVFSDTLRQFGQLGSAGLQLMFLKFGRDDERESDELGMRYAHRAGYDVREMPGVFEVLKAVSNQGDRGRVPEWMATHPDPENRVKAAKARLAKLDLQPEGASRMTVDRHEYLAMLNGMVYGPNPRQGYFKGDRFYHPEMRFTLDLPAGWKKANLPEAVVAMSPNQDAAAQLTLTKAASPEEALRAFSAQQGIQVGRASTGLVTGFPSASAEFAAKTEQGELAGVVTFIGHGGKTFQLVTFSPATAAAGYASAFQSVHRSFAHLTDPNALNVQPARLALEVAPRAMTLAELYRERPSTIPLPELALLNQIEPTATLTSGQQLKWVRGGSPELLKPQPSGSQAATPSQAPPPTHAPPPQ